jgi:hypothetical protein
MQTQPHVRADSRLRPQGRGEGTEGMHASAQTTMSAWTLGCVRGCPMSARTHDRVRADASVLPPCNFITDAIMRLSHGRPSGHRPTIRPSVIVCVTTLPVLAVGLG